MFHQLEVVSLHITVKCSHLLLHPLLMWQFSSCVNSVSEQWFLYPSIFHNISFSTNKTPWMWQVGLSDLSAASSWGFPGEGRISATLQRFCCWNPYWGHKGLCEMEDSLVERSGELPFSLFQKEHPKSPWKLIALLIRMCVVLMELTLPPAPKVSIWPRSGEWEQCRVSVSQICNQKQACFIGPSSCFFWDSSVTSRLTVPALP